MFRTMLSVVALAGATFVLTGYQPAAADFDMKAGPIWNQGEAQAKCDKACALTWNGQWVTKVMNTMSICSGQNTAADGKNYTTDGGLEAGPIWNNDDAKTKCPAAMSKVKWNGQWTTTQQGVMSVCGCTGTVVPWKPNINEK